MPPAHFPGVNLTTAAQPSTTTAGLQHFNPAPINEAPSVHIITHECLENDPVRCVKEAVEAGAVLKPEDYVRIGDLYPVFDWSDPFSSIITPTGGLPYPTEACHKHGECKLPRLFFIRLSF